MEVASSEINWPSNVYLIHAQCCNCCNSKRYKHWHRWWKSRNKKPGCKHRYEPDLTIYICESYISLNHMFPPASIFPDTHHSKTSVTVIVIIIVVVIDKDIKINGCVSNKKTCMHEWKSEYGYKTHKTCHMQTKDHHNNNHTTTDISFFLRFLLQNKMSAHGQTVTTKAAYASKRKSKNSSSLLFKESTQVWHDLASVRWSKPPHD